MEKEKKSIILNIKYKAEFFEIPFSIPIPLEEESDVIILERKVRKLELEREKDKEEMKEEIGKEVKLLKQQLGNVIFLPTCEKPIPMWITEITLEGKLSGSNGGNFINQTIPTPANASSFSSKPLASAVIMRSKLSASASPCFSIANAIASLTCASARPT